MTAHGLAIERKWPFVTLTAFQERASTAMKISEVLYVGMNPLVTDDLRPEWEYYSNFDNDASWYSEAREYQQALGIDSFDLRAQVETEDPELDFSDGIANHIYNYDRTGTRKASIASKDESYLPVWQVSIIAP